MPTYDATNWPPLEIVQPTPQLENWQAQSPPTPPSQAAPVVTTASVTWAAAAPLPNTTTYYSPVTTQVAIDTQFNIVDRRLLPAETTLDANGNQIILAPPL
jgi:hypothetical protein